MRNIEVKEVFHQGWPDPEWIRGFEITIEPPLKAELSSLGELMTATELEGVEPEAIRVTFERLSHRHSNEATHIYAGGEDIAHYGMLGSHMNQLARESLTHRLGFLLLSEAPEDTTT